MTGSTEHAGNAKQLPRVLVSLCDLLIARRPSESNYESCKDQNPANELAELLVRLLSRSVIDSDLLNEESNLQSMERALYASRQSSFDYIVTMASALTLLHSYATGVHWNAANAFDRIILLLIATECAINIQDVRLDEIVEFYLWLQQQSTIRCTTLAFCIVILSGEQMSRAIDEHVLLCNDKAGQSALTTEEFELQAASVELGDRFGLFWGHRQDLVDTLFRVLDNLRGWLTRYGRQGSGGKR